MRSPVIRIIATTTLALALWKTTSASDHFDGPSVLDDPTTDITDMYVFPSPEQPERLVLIMDIYPNAGPSKWFSDALEYRFRLSPVSISNTRANAGFKVSEDEVVFSCTFNDLKNAADSMTQHGQCRTPKGKIELTVNQATADQDYSESGVRAFAGLRLDPFFMDVEGFIRSLKQDKINFRGKNSAHRINCLSIIIEFDSKKFLPDAKGMYGIVAEIRTRGKMPIVMDTFGRPEVTNVILDDPGYDQVNQSIDVRDLYNRNDPFADADAGPYAGPFRTRFDANLHRIDSLDGNIDWPLKDGVHALTELQFADFTVIDLSKPVGVGSWFEIEKAIVEGREHTTGGGRWLNDDICDVQYTYLIARDRKKIGDGVDQPTKPATDRFPYLWDPLT